MVGLVAGENIGNIENCILTNCQIVEKRSEISETKNSVSYVGGVVGYNRSGTVKNIAFITNRPVYEIIGKIWTGVIAGESDSGVFSNILVYKKTTGDLPDGAIVGIMEAVYSRGNCKNPYKMINCINCFGDRPLIYGYGSSAEKTACGKIENSYTLNEPILIEEDLPNGYEDWNYSEEFQFYIPCSGFDN